MITGLNSAFAVADVVRDRSEAVRNLPGAYVASPASSSTTR